MGNPRKRIEAISELFYSEKSYVEDLKLWHVGLRADILNIESIPPKTRYSISNSIFTNMNKIYQFHKLIFAEMKDANHRLLKSQGVEIERPTDPIISSVRRTSQQDKSSNKNINDRNINNNSKNNNSKSINDSINNNKNNSRNNINSINNRNDSNRNDSDLLKRINANWYKENSDDPLNEFYIKKDGSIDTSSLEYASIFLKYFECVSFYESFSAMLPKAEYEFNVLMATNSAFSECVTSWMERHSLTNLGPKHFFYRPSGKMARYPLLLKAILKSTTSDEQTELYNQLISKIKAATRKIDRIFKARSELFNLYRLNDLMQFSTQLGDLKSDSISRATALGLIFSRKKLVKDGPLIIKLDQHSPACYRHIYIFDRQIVICKSITSPYDPIEILLRPLPLSRIKVLRRALPRDKAGNVFTDDENLESHQKIYLVLPSEGVFVVLYFSDAATRDLYYSKIKSIQVKIRRKFNLAVGLERSHEIGNERLRAACFDESEAVYFSSCLISLSSNTDDIIRNGSIKDNRNDINRSDINRSDSDFVSDISSDSDKSNDRNSNRSNRSNDTNSNKRNSDSDDTNKSKLNKNKFDKNKIDKKTNVNEYSIESYLNTSSLSETSSIDSIGWSEILDDSSPENMLRKLSLEQSMGESQEETLSEDKQGFCRELFNSNDLNSSKIVIKKTRAVAHLNINNSNSDNSNSNSDNSNSNSNDSSNSNNSSSSDSDSDNSSGSVIFKGKNKHTKNSSSDNSDSSSSDSKDNSNSSDSNSSDISSNDSNKNNDISSNDSNREKIIFYSTNLGIYAKNSSSLKLISKTPANKIIYDKKRELLFFLADQNLCIASYNFSMDEISAEKIDCKIDDFYYGEFRNQIFIAVSANSSFSFSMIYLLNLIDDGNEWQLLFNRKMYVGYNVANVSFLNNSMVISCKDFEIVDVDTLRTQALLGSFDPATVLVSKAISNLMALSIFQVEKETFLLCFDGMGFYVDALGAYKHHHLVFFWDMAASAFKIYARHVICLSDTSIGVFSLDTAQCVYLEDIPRLAFVNGTTEPLLYSGTKIYRVANLGDEESASRSNSLKGSVIKEVSDIDIELSDSDSDKGTSSTNTLSLIEEMRRELTKAESRVAIDTKGMRNVRSESRIGNAISSADNNIADISRVDSDDLCIKLISKSAYRKRKKIRPEKYIERMEEMKKEWRIRDAKYVEKEKLRNIFNLTGNSIFARQGNKKGGCSLKVNVHSKSLSGNKDHNTIANNNCMGNNSRGNSGNSGGSNSTYGSRVSNGNNGSMNKEYDGSVNEEYDGGLNIIKFLEAKNRNIVDCVNSDIRNKNINVREVKDFKIKLDNNDNNQKILALLENHSGTGDKRNVNTGDILREYKDKEE
ncbi:hypothetical protein ENBRE01_0298 [Enteropsectra breve]|nr:hypothetical protein ENBRE01_0298 [Enteropsectra breve]